MSKKEPEILDREAAFNALKQTYKDILDPLSFEKVSPENILPTPSISMNLLCGEDKGIRKGSIVHTYGPRGSLKTWIGLEMCRQAQQKWPEKAVAFIDTECRVDLYQASSLIGVQCEPYETGVPRMIYRRPEYAEEAWELIGNLAATEHISLIVLDSATAMRSKSVVDNPEFSLGQVGNAARINSAALQKYAPLITKTGTILWAINQERLTSVVPVVSKGPTGGAAWGFYASHEFKLEKITREREEINQFINVVSNKMKWALGYRSVTVPVILGHGIDQSADIISCAIEAGIVTQSGSWIQINNEKIQGLKKASKYLDENPLIKAELVSVITELGT